jgi:hypothetical protein
VAITATGRQATDIRIGRRITVRARLATAAHGHRDKAERDRLGMEEITEHGHPVKAAGRLAVEVEAAIARRAEAEVVGADAPATEVSRR